MPPSSRLVLLRAGSAVRSPLFLVHSYAGSVLQLRPLVQALPGERPIYGIQPRGVIAGEEPHRRVEDMAAEYLAAIRTAQPRGPYTLGGFSFGGLVALEIARRLHGQGETVDFLAMLDTSVDRRFLSWAERLQRARSHLGHHVRSGITASPERRRAYLADMRDKLDARVDRMRVRLGIGPSRPDHGRWWQSPDLPPALRRVQDAITVAAAHYRPAAYAGRITFFQAEGDDPACPYPASTWHRLTHGNVEVCRVPGDHATMVQQPNVKALAAELARYL